MLAENVPNKTSSKPSLVLYRVTEWSDGVGIVVVFPGV